MARPNSAEQAPAADDLARDRKAEHIHLALDGRMQLGANPLDAWRLEHAALPEIDLASVDTSVAFLGRRLDAPLLISCMTGGTDIALAINQRLAEAAEATGVALGVGSQRRALEDAAQRPSFQVRAIARRVPLLANLGAVQLNYGCGIEACRAAVAMIDADALVLHLNPLQEAIQPEGQGNFAGLVSKMGAVARALEVPVVVKEVGSGLSAATGRRLLEAGIGIFDTAGVGGTSWARIEAARAGDGPLGEAFADWGLTTPESIAQLRTLPDATIIGSGGLRSGVDVAKVIAMGAHLAGLAQPFLEAALVSAEAVVARIERIVRELRIAMFCTGARTIDDLRRAPIRKESLR